MTHDESRAEQPPTKTGRVPRRTVLVLLAAAPVLAVLTLGAVGLLRGAPATDPRPSAATLSQPPVPTPQPTGAPACPQRGVGHLAGLLFDWDAASSTRQAVVRRVASLADPSGIETPGLLADLDGYLPPEDAWTLLAGYRTRQTLTGIRSRVPDTWPAIATADHARLRAGIAAFNIDGTRHRTGVADGAPSTFSDRVTFTMIVSCTPGDVGWRLLRLSRLGDPLP